ncbi:tRNA lysidine(34) synthetase TilS [Roseibium porphyridii]|uniref:tRNA(Ile)-lysidine synthase n=1 Tax=Roseibium porphyridii TaxID=2866279 RepID=A0ABY8F8A3_9HYPH|nr:tRNA lysidine(34) synthetase TilS [Roseibium sp. KMA01]WFE90759.1 tRNA lysidine(34) synthetase TilS [Roseibium sp. KMA01]
MSAAVHNVPDGPVEPRGLPVEDVDLLFSKLNSFSSLALAVSGGADSLCLMVLFDEWRQRTGWRGSTEVLIVDHRLRAESAEEASFVVREASKRGLPVTVLHWVGPKPLANIQEEARVARYRLFAKRLSETGGQGLLLGHHLDDQAETFLDRLTRGSGVSGLSAMAADEPDGPEGLRLLRPFLGVRKLQLEASLMERGLSWCSDPSNKDEKYKRSRLRRILGLLEAEGLTPERIFQTSAHVRRARHALEVSVKEIAKRLLVEHPAGPVKLSLPAYRDLAEEFRLRLLGVVLDRVRGQRTKRRFSSVEALDNGLMSKDGFQQTLSGCQVRASEQTIWCWREPGRKAPPTLAPFTGGGIWDNRFRYKVPDACEHSDVQNRLFLGPLCDAPISRSAIIWPEGWPREVFDCSPVIWTDAGIALNHVASVSFEHDISDRCEDLELERLPNRVKLPGNHFDEDAENGEI